MVQDKNGVHILITSRNHTGHTEDLFATLKRNQFGSGPYRPAANVKGIAVGSRDASGWTFHYQVWAQLLFDVYSILDGDPSTSLRVDNPRGSPDFEGRVILDHGELWPNETHHAW